MSEIPDDVMKAAQDQWVAATKDLEPGDVFSNIDIVARGIMAERERCARIAERFAVANLVDEEATDASSVAQSIANTIRMAVASETGKAA